jgi:hypothetical protein
MEAQIKLGRIFGVQGSHSIKSSWAKRPASLAKDAAL